MKLFLRRPLHKVVYCIVYRTSVSCSRQGLVAWESIWLRRTQLSSLTLTGTPRTTCRHKPEPIELVRRSRSVVRDIWTWFGGEAVKGRCVIQPFRMFVKCFFPVLLSFPQGQMPVCLLVRRRCLWGYDELNQGVILFSCLKIMSPMAFRFTPRKRGDEQVQSCGMFLYFNGISC